MYSNKNKTYNGNRKKKWPNMQNNVKQTKKKPSIRCLPTASNKSVYTVSSATI